ncbi:hypothetical protein B5S29_g3037 [[Candida] boidinii]|nr:hypothetical protein B5S29_g3037 [[Candida] boidinii]
MQVLYFCPCNESNLQESMAKEPNLIRCLDSLTSGLVPLTIYDEDLQHDLEALLFCSNCQEVRCSRCTRRKFMIKYCPRCLVKTNSIEQTDCQKNCFTCPTCSNYLEISSKTHYSDEESSPENEGKKSIKGKSFIFNCSWCKYEYDTGLISRPQPLNRIIGQQKKENCFVNSRFRGLRDNYSRQYQVNNYINASAKERLILQRELIKSFSSLEIARFSKTKHFEFQDFPVFEYRVKENENENQDTDKEPKTNSDDKKIKIHDIDNSNEPKFPISAVLKSKCTTHCKNCDKLLLQPDDNPIQTKPVKSSFAVNLLPKLYLNHLKGDNSDFKFSENKQYKILISFANQASFKMSFTISTASTYDKFLNPIDNTQTNSPSYPSVNEKNERDISVIVRLPCTNFSLGPKPDKLNKPVDFVKTIPTIQLTDETKVSKAELVMRDPVALTKISAVPKSKETDISDFSDDLSFAQPVDSGVNWCTVPLIVDIKSDPVKKEMLKIPLYVTIASGETEDEEQDSKVGFWSILNLGKIRNE